MDDDKLRPRRRDTMSGATTRHQFAVAARFLRRLPPSATGDTVLRDTRALAGAMARTLAAWPVHAPDPVEFRNVSVADMRAVIALALRSDRPDHPSIRRLASALGDVFVDPRHRPGPRDPRDPRDPRNQRNQRNPLDD